MKLVSLNTLFIVLIATMVVVSGLQTLQLVSLTKALADGKVAVSGGTAVGSSGSSAGTSGQPGSLSSLPSMVGGC